MAAIHSIQTNEINPEAHRSVLLLCLKDIEEQLNRIDALAFAARRMHEANEANDNYDPTSARLFGMIEHETEDRAAIIELRAALNRLLPV